MKKLVALALTLVSVFVFSTALASSVAVENVTISVNGESIEEHLCENENEALCIPLIPVATKLGYTLDKSELEEGGAYRVVYTLTPSQPGSQLMVAYSVENELPTAVAISKDQILLPLEQSMTLKDGLPYLPAEFFETGMCVEFSLDEDAGILSITPIAQDAE
ncbi:MAG: hypothetical protein RR994_06420 [Clostridia bacterium]